MNADCLLVRYECPWSFSAMPLKAGLWWLCDNNAPSETLFTFGEADWAEGSKIVAWAASHGKNDGRCWLTKAFFRRLTLFVTCFCPHCSFHCQAQKKYYHNFGVPANCFGCIAAWQKLVPWGAGGGYFLVLPPALRWTSTCRLLFWKHCEQQSTNRFLPAQPWSRISSRKISHIKYVILCNTIYCKSM